jgi:hypothetical protein
MDQAWTPFAARVKDHAEVKRRLKCAGPVKESRSRKYNERDREAYSIWWCTRARELEGRELELESMWSRCPDELCWIEKGPGAEIETEASSSLALELPPQCLRPQRLCSHCIQTAKGSRMTATYPGLVFSRLALTPFAYA